MKSTSRRQSKRPASGAVAAMPSQSFQPLRSNWREILRSLIHEHASKNPDYLHGGKASLRRYSFKLGTNPTLIWEWLDRSPPKEPQFSSVAKLMTILEKPITLLLDDTNVAALPAPTRAPVVGIVEAGAWREPEMLDFQADLWVPVVVDPQYAMLKQSAWIVRGQSINRVASDGDTLITVRYQELGRGPRDGELVICERHRHGQVEYTAKRYRVAGNRVRLDPDSTDPRFQTPIWMPGDEDGDEEVVVMAEHLAIQANHKLA